MSTRRSITLLLAAAPVVAIAVSLTLGPANLSLGDLWNVFASAADERTRAIVLAVRLPRVLLAALVGMALGMSGATLQSALRNPLAEPYLLGVSGGAAVGAVLVVVLGVPLVSLGAFAGALAAVVVTLGIVRGVGGMGDSRTLLMAGVVLGAFANAAIMILLTTAPEHTVRGALWWMMGSTNGAVWRDVGLLAVAVVIGGAALLALAPRLDALALGPDSAASLGVEPERTAWWSYAGASLLAAASVSVAGLVGFVGLVVPHLARRALAGRMRATLVASAAIGAALLVAADAAARTVLAPAELPLGAVTALLGVPFFLWQMRRGK